MLEISKGQDQLMEMFDKVQLLNLSSEGAEILKSMADSIRSALEKGLLLEQIILNQRNNSLNNDFPENSPTKIKKKCKSIDSGALHVQFKDIVEELRSACNVESHKNNVSSSEILNRDIVNKSDMNAASYKASEVPAINKPPPILEGKIKLANTSLLLNIISPPPPQTENETSLFSCSPHLNHSSPNMLANSSSKPELLQATVQEPLTQEKLIHSTNFENSTIEYQLPSSSEIAENGLLIPKKESDSELDSSSNALEHSTPICNTNEDGNILNLPSQPNLPSQNNYDCPVMPTPFLIKCEPRVEHMHSEPEHFIALPCEESAEQADLNHSGDIGDLKNNSGANDRMSPCLVNNQTGNDATENVYKVYIEAGRGATDGEVIKLFENKGLHVKECKIINKLQHSFGFITFENEVCMKKALNLNNKLLVHGKKMSVRQCFKERNKTIHFKQSYDNNKQNIRKRNSFPNTGSPRKHNFSEKSFQQQKVDSSSFHERSSQSKSISSYDMLRNDHRSNKSHEPQSLLNLKFPESQNFPNFCDDLQQRPLSSRDFMTSEDHGTTQLNFPVPSSHRQRRASCGDYASPAREHRVACTEQSSAMSYHNNTYKDTHYQMKGGHNTYPRNGKNYRLDAQYNRQKFNQRYRVRNMFYNSEDKRKPYNSNNRSQ